MASTHDLIDAQFDRAVEIVQSLPKTGPIQTDYEEKLTMYSLFKQATAGNVKTPRPGIWDMLGRAKWDAWAKHKDLESFEAKWLYVESLLKVLRKYSDKTVAMNLVEELESYGGDPSHIVMSRELNAHKVRQTSSKSALTGTLSKSPGSDASGSTLSEPVRNTIPPALMQQLHSHGEETDSTSDEESEDEVREMPVPIANLGRRSVDTSRVSLDNRPQSSLSSQQRYRTPLATSLVVSPPPSHSHTPSQQPLPGFQTPSAFADSIPPVSTPPNIYAGAFEDSRGEMMSPSHLYPGHPSYGSQIQPNRSAYQGTRPPSAVALERAVENVQVHLAALTERIELLESRSLLLSRSNISGSPRGSRGSPSWMAGGGSPDGNAPPIWDINDLGMWSFVLNPLSRGWIHLRELSTFFARNENRTPTMIIIRRLCLDISFLACVIAIVGAIWRKSGVRRREVRVALIVLWRAILGTKPERMLGERSA